MTILRPIFLASFPSREPQRTPDIPCAMCSQERPQIDLADRGASGEGVEETHGVVCQSSRSLPYIISFSFSTPSVPHCDYSLHFTEKKNSNSGVTSRIVRAELI